MTNFFIIVNGRSRGKILVKRDIRHGDPLVPFLFMIVRDALSCLIHYCNEKRSLKGFHSENLSDDLTHLQYADDTLLFSFWEDGNLETWWKVINIFLLEVDLSLNIFKIFLIGINLNSCDLAPYTNFMGCSVDSFPFNYLNFSIGGGRNRKEM